MKNDQYSPFVLTLNHASATLEQVGGKGASLAHMAAGLPVPAGFHVNTVAFRRFVKENELNESSYAALAVNVSVMTTLFWAIAMFARFGGSMPKSVR